MLIPAARCLEALYEHFESVPALISHAALREQKWVKTRNRFEPLSPRFSYTFPD